MMNLGFYIGSIDFQTITDGTLIEIEIRWKQIRTSPAGKIVAAVDNMVEGRVLWSDLLSKYMVDSLAPVG
jgi:hypothetical protein